MLTVLPYNYQFRKEYSSKAQKKKKISMKVINEEINILYSCQSQAKQPNCSVPGAAE